MPPAMPDRPATPPVVDMVQTGALTEAEKEYIINKLFNVIEMKTIIKDKVSMCKKCKFNQHNMNLHKLRMPDSIVKNCQKHL